MGRARLRSQGWRGIQLCPPSSGCAHRDLWGLPIGRGFNSHRLHHCSQVELSLSVSGALERGRLLACCGVCGAILGLRHFPRDADEFTPVNPDFTPKTAFSASLSLFDADLSNPSASREISRFVCLVEGAVRRRLAQPCGGSQQVGAGTATNRYRRRDPLGEAPAPDLNSASVGCAEKLRYYAACCGAEAHLGTTLWTSPVPDPVPQI